MRQYPSLLSTLHRNPHMALLIRNEINTTKDIAMRDGLATLLNVASETIDRECKSYVVSDSLMSALKEVDFSEVGPWHLKGVQALHFIFKKNSIKDENYSYQEMFVTILPPQQVLGAHKNFDTDKYKITIYLVGPVTEKGELPGIYLGTKYSEGDTIEQIMEQAKRDLNGAAVELDLKMEVISLALNLILYLHSPDPEIMALKPQIYNTRNFRENYFPKAKDESSLLGIFSLGWDFHGREYSVDIGTRRGHPRWQPCGPKWCNRKLIFIQPTTINYSKGQDQ